MRHLFHPSLVNDVFGDPALYVEFNYERRALLFDLGEIQSLTPRRLLRVSHIFVSHAHMDHFAGLDRLVRICLARPMRIHLYGPRDFLDRVEHRLAGYTWNLVQNYADDFTLCVHELDGAGGRRSAEFHTRQAFRRVNETSSPVIDDLILEEFNFRVRCMALDHRIPSLAYALEEARHANVLKNRLHEQGLRVGPWLNELKTAVLDDAPDHTTVSVETLAGDVESRPVGDLRDVVRITPGRKLVYVTDCAGHDANASRILALARDADLLYIEAPFLDEHSADAARKYHLTARRAGDLGRLAGARRVIPFHFSTRYEDCPDRLYAEVAAAFDGRYE